MEFPPPPPPERSKRLHNFTLPYLRWGQQRFLRCVKLPHLQSPSLPSSSSAPSPDRANHRSHGVSGGAVDEPTRIIESSLRRHKIGVKRGCEDGDGDSLKTKKVKLSVSLLREEIEEDFLVLMGKKPPRRPKKRPRLVQKQMNTLFPGLWLTEEVTVDSYNGPEAAET